MSNKLKIKVQEARSNFGVEFTVSDDLYGGTDFDEYGFSSYSAALKHAKELSLQHPNTPFTINVAINSPAVINGKVMEIDDCEKLLASLETNPQQ